MLSSIKNLFILSASIALVSCNNTSDKTAQPTKSSSHEQHEMKDAAVGYADSVNYGLIEKDSLKGSPARTAMLTLGKTHLHIEYHSPGVKGRIIWGGLVPYQTVWVTGAHSATSLTINQPIEIENKKIEAGTYAIFSIPDEKEWTFILNKNHKQHLADDYSESDDVLRIKITPAVNPMMQRLTYKISKLHEDTGEISMEWEKLKIKVPFKVLN